MKYHVQLSGPRSLVTCETQCHIEDEAEVMAHMRRDGWSLGQRDPDGQFVDLYWSRDRKVLEMENERLWFLLRGEVNHG